MSLSRLIAACIFCTSAWQSNVLLGQPPQEMVTIQWGELPIILTAPHGGSRPITGVEKREGKGVRQFKTVSDSYTDQLAENLANAIEKRLGKRPHLIIARFHRKYLDANRPRSLAYESDAARSVYDTYHDAIAKARRNIIARWGHGILIDLHGQGAEPQMIFRGTQNGRTTRHLQKRFGNRAVAGDTSFFGRLAEQGFRVYPAVDSNEAEHPSYDGGYTVRTYGSSDGSSFDAIQLELGKGLRLPDVSLVTAEKIADALTAFTADFGPDPSHNASRRNVWSADLASGRDGWVEIDDDASTLKMAVVSGQLNDPPELSFSATDSSSLNSFATHFPPVELKRAGDQISLTFEAKHNTKEFVDRGFRFGLFDSGGTRLDSDGDHDFSPASLDDDGYFVLLDLGRSTTNTSALIRETNNHQDERLWGGKTIARADNDGLPDPLMFTRDEDFVYTLTLTRRDDGNIDVELSNRVSGQNETLRGVSSVTPTRTVDTIYFGTYGSTAKFAIDNVVVQAGQRGGEISTDKKVCVGVYIDKGTGKSRRSVLRALSNYEEVDLIRLRADDIRSGKLNELDVLIQPGGSGGGQGRHLGETGREAIRDHVRNGGGFIGICGGAYLASADYDWSLNILDAKVVDRKHWARGHGDVRLGLTDVGKKLLKTNDDTLSILYWQGPLLAPADRPEIDDFETLATFETEIAENGAPKGVMKGTTAIAKGRFGNGRVVCFSPHPESTEGLEHFVKLAVDHVTPFRAEK